ncbi:MAG TPA: MarR family transcriptional regulator [Ktedonobacteraceae bacterium]|nr:MarR family transcriptional regulator [Ktedonobacteraceae bacterium]
MTHNDETEISGQVEAFLAAWFRTRQSVMEANFHRAHHHRLSTTQFMVLNLLEDGAPWTLRMLADAMNLETPTLVRTIDSLEQRGLVARQRNAADRRQIHISLTQTGRELQTASQQQFRARLIAIFQAMQPEDRQALINGLSAFGNAANTRQEQE